jgi:hypothetical protein
MDTSRLLLGLVLFMGGLGMMAIGVIYLNSLNICTAPSSIGPCGNPWIAYSFIIIGVVFVVFGAFVLARARFAITSGPFARQYSSN